VTGIKSHLHPVLPDAGKHISWSNLHGSGLGINIAEAARNCTRLLVIVLEDQHKLEILETEIRYFLEGVADIPVMAFPGWECLPYDVFSPHEEIVSSRLRMLANLPEMEKGVILIQVSDLTQRLPPTDYVLGHSFSLKQAQYIDLDTLRQQLATANYAAVNQVMSPGEFAVRGGLVDIFPMGQQFPFRLDLLDDELESIRLFDPGTQRSGQQVEDIELLPAREFPMTESGIRKFRAAFRQHFEGDPRKQSVYNDISSGKTPAGAEFFFPLFFEHTATFFDYLGPGCTIVKVPEFNDSLGTNWAVINDRYTNANYDLSRKVLPPSLLYLEPDETRSLIQPYAGIDLHRNPRADSSWQADTAPNRQFPVDPRKDNPYGELVSHLDRGKNRVLVAVETHGRREALESVFKLNGFKVDLVDHFNDFLEDTNSSLGLTIAPLERGLTCPHNGLEIICESQLYGERVYQRRRRSVQSKDPDSIIKSLAELNIGDPVVHLEHGVGRYCGLQVLEIEGEESEFLALEYLNGDKLYLPILALNLVSRFIGGSPEQAPLHRLGGDQWEKSKKKARTKAYDVATELLEIEAFRNARNGQEFLVDQVEMEGFICRFPFEETPDQQQVIAEILADLRSPDPMDRLVCGDVGFGKTEIALRAAFVVATCGKQVAILTPTTLLAQQHFQTFSERFSDWPINVAMLSRFKTKKQIIQIIEGLRTGSVDIVIATHRLLQDDIAFSDLGLLVIDEEHRFGVRQKERIKRLRSQVDILTLTATPIPRTLNMPARNQAWRPGIFRPQ
jgi:transcription-repair coupling factor (superfamily II helicase)